MRRPTPRRLVAAVVAASLLAAGCSSDDGDGDSAGDAAPGTGSSTTTTEAAVAVTYPAGAWERVDPEDEGFDPDALEAVAEHAGDAGSTCLVVTRRGRIVGEWYWQGTDTADTQEVFSVTKSITSTLVGIAVDDGDLALDTPAAEHIDEWQGTPSEEVTVENLLSNDSGREWSLALDYVQMPREADRTQFAIDLGQQYPPGEAWSYNNAAIQTLGRVLEGATGEEPHAYAEERLFAPTGMDATEMTRDPSGGTNMFFGLRSSCEDLARFGYLFLRDGEWDGTEVLSPEWVEAATGAPSQEHNAAYGFLWWLNHEGPIVGATQAVTPEAEPTEQVGQAIPGAPEDLFTAQGLGGQIVMVDPGSEVVAVRLAVGDGERPFGTTDLATVVTEALVDP